MDIFDFGDDDSVKAIIKKAAELFEFPAFQLYLTVQGNSKLKNALLKYDVSFYEDAIKRINALSSESTKVFERAKLQRLVFGESGISSGDVRKMCEKMDDMYYR